MTKAKIELTAEVVRKAIEEGKPASMTQLAHSLGYKGSVSGSLTSKLRKLIVGIDDLLAANKAKGDVAGLIEKAAKPALKGKAIKTDKVEPKPVKVRGGKYPHDPRNVFRPGSNYALVFNVLASFPNGLEKAKLVELVSAASGKDLVHAGYDCQVLLSAKGNEPGLSRNDGPRHRSCRSGFWINRNNTNVKLMVDKR
jgi:hypothetical protein